MVERISHEYRAGDDVELKLMNLAMCYTHLLVAESGHSRPVDGALEVVESILPPAPASPAVDMGEAPLTIGFAVKGYCMAEVIFERVECLYEAKDCSVVTAVSVDSIWDGMVGGCPCNSR